MANLINAIVDISPQRLNFPLRTLHARQLHSFTVQIDNIPDDTTSVSVRVFRTIGGFYDIPVTRHGAADTTGIAYIIGTCFAATGSTTYEIHAYDARGNMTALGAGLIEIAPFSASGEPIAPGASIPIEVIHDAQGGTHSLVAVQNDLGEWTYIIDEVPDGAIIREIGRVRAAQNEDGTWTAEIIEENNTNA